MNKKSSVFILSIVSFFATHLYALTGQMPKETAILQLPDHSESNWKVIAHYVKAKDSAVELIPCNQTTQNWSELISVQHIGVSWDKPAHNLEKILEHMRTYTLSSHPDNTVSWQLIEKNNEEATYECIVHAFCNNIPTEHEISHVFLTSTGFHRVGFSRRGSYMSSEEKAKWIQLLRENTSVIPFQVGKSMRGFSIAMS